MIKKSEIRRIALLLSMSVLIAFSTCGCTPTKITDKNSKGGSSVASRESNVGNSQTASSTALSTAGVSSLAQEMSGSNVYPESTPSVNTVSVPNTQPYGSYISFWTTDALTDVFTDTVRPSDATESGTINMAKNEYESIQIAMRSTRKLTNVKVKVNPFPIANAPTVSVYPIRDLYCSVNSYEVDASNLRRKAPAYFPEYYDKTDSIGNIDIDKSASVCVEAATTKNTKPGAYKTTVQIYSSQGMKTIPITVVVYNVTIPDPKDSSFSYTNWFDSATEPGTETDNMLDLYFNAGVQSNGAGYAYNDNFWNLLKNYANVMKKERQNTIWVPMSDLLLSDSKINANGTVTFNWTNFDKYINLFLSNASVKYLEGSHIWNKNWFINNDDSHWPTDSCVGWYFALKNGKNTVQWDFVDENDPSSHVQKFESSFLPQLYSHLKSKGWDKMWIQHVCDEPDPAVQVPQIQRMYKKLRTIMPTIRTLDAGSKMDQFFGPELTNPCPELDYYESDKKAFQNENNKNGVNVWFYTCINPEGKYMSRLGDIPLNSTRVLGWYAYDQGIHGYLHWAWNLWYWPAPHQGQVFNDIVSTGPAVDDAWLVYPDSKDLSVYEGPRSTAVRDGFEDYDLISIAGKKNKTATDSIVNSIVQSGTNYERVSAKTLSARVQLLKIASGE